MLLLIFGVDVVTFVGSSSRYLTCSYTLHPITILSVVHEMFCTLFSVIILSLYNYSDSRLLQLKNVSLFVLPMSFSLVFTLTPAPPTFYSNFVFGVHFTCLMIICCWIVKTENTMPNKNSLTVTEITTGIDLMDDATIRKVILYVLFSFFFGRLFS
jgi:hypothetical protein